MALCSRVVFFCVIDFADILRAGHRVEIYQPAIQAFNYVKRANSKQMLAYIILA